MYQKKRRNKITRKTSSNNINTSNNAHYYKHLFLKHNNSIPIEKAKDAAMSFAHALQKSSLRQYISYHNSIPLLSTFAFLVLGMMLINPSAEGELSAYAEEPSAQADTGMEITLTMDTPNVNTLVSQAKLGEVNYISTGFNVSTTNVDEYSIYVQTAPGYSNKLTNGNLTIDFVKSSGTPTTSFGDNEWGYAVGESGADPAGLFYNPVPDAGATINPAYSTKDTANDKSFSLNFAAKFGTNATPGHYTSNVILSVAAGAKQVTALPTWTITNMQDMNSTICANAEINTTGRLTDLRDGKQYWVSKLADGNCWMTQNLDFDVPSTLSSDKTNVDSTIQTDTTKVATPADWNSTDKTYNAYYDPGDYYYNGPNGTHAQGAACDNTTGLGDCEQFSTTGDSHYHVGNYYSWPAATVKSGDSLTAQGDQAPNSICPKGWTLPTGGASGQYNNLLTQYGVNNSLTNGDYAIYKDPLYFAYDGYLFSHTLYNAGNRGSYWSSTVNSDTDAFRLTFHSRVYIDNGNTRSYGFSVRCVATSFAEAQTLETATYMQEVTAKTCERSTMEKQVQLADYRDGKKYWVAKLKDGNCWMTQNLDFDIPDTLNATASDVSGVVETNTTKITTPGGWSDNTAIYNAYYDPGDYVYNGPSSSHSQGTSCNVADNSTLSSCEQFTTTAANTHVDGNTANHYHIGNYYSWSAATAKSGDSLTTRNDSASSSICPKGWQLPTSGNADNNSAPYNTSKTFAKLFESYGWKWNQVSYANNLNGGTSYNIYASPFYFTYGGHLSSNKLNDAGNYGRYWSSTAYSDVGTFILNFYSVTYPSDSDTRYSGESVRCIVR